MTNEVLTVIKRRRSIRAYEQKQLKDEEIQTILDAGMWAPSGGNGQPWYFTVVQKQELLKEISDVAKVNAQQVFPQMKNLLGNESFHVFHNAPTVVFVSGTTGSQMETQVVTCDTSAAVQNMLLAAESLDIGSVWMLMPLVAFEGEKGQSFVKRLQIPEGYKVMHAVSLGYKKVTPEKGPERKENKINYIR